MCVYVFSYGVQRKKHEIFNYMLVRQKWYSTDRFGKSHRLARHKSIAIIRFYARICNMCNSVYICGHIHKYLRSWDINFQPKLNVNLHDKFIFVFYTYKIAFLMGKKSIKRSCNNLVVFNSFPSYTMSWHLYRHLCFGRIRSNKIIKLMAYLHQPSL